MAAVEPVTEFEVGTTVNQYIAAMERAVPNASGALSTVLMEIVVTCKLIASKIKMAGIADILGKSGTANTTGDDQAKLDVQSDLLMQRRLLSLRHVCAFLSEEQDDVIFPEEEEHKLNGHYIVASDPLDGSSNIDCNIPTGTIFGIWKRKSEDGTVPDESDFLQPGRNQVCSGYVLYGSAVMLVISLGLDAGVHGFTLDPSIGEFVLTHENMQYPDVCKCYSINEGNTSKWTPGVQAFVQSLKDQGVSQRYVGSAVADVHRNFIKGGIFAYPASNGKPKLRLMYECNPMGFLSVAAGGGAHTGEENVLDVVPTSIHQRVALYLGNADVVESAVQFIAQDNE